MGSFGLKKGSLEKVVSTLISSKDVIHKNIERKVELITEVVYKTATARRPKISQSQQKQLGRSKSGYRVSDPNARIGVPVDTGALRGSITKKVSSTGSKVTGEIDAGQGLVYAKMIEFGTSKMAPRPFMRPAWNENLEWIRRKFREKIEKI